jgi:prepilin-type N-terminal cleavage/methylation domain-containing protein
VKKSRQSGFTFFELMIVTAIIGILAAISIPSFFHYLDRAQWVEPLVFAESIKKNVSRFYDRWGRFPLDNHEAGLAAPDSYVGRYVEGITLDDGIIYITVNTRGSGAQVIWFQPAVSIAYPTGPVSWRCMDGAIPEGMRAVGTVKATDPAANKSSLPHYCR